MLLIKRKFKSCIIFAASAFAGVFAFLLTWLTFFLQLERDLGSKNEVGVNLISALVNLLAFFNSPVYPLNLGNAEFFYSIFYLWHYL